MAAGVVPIHRSGLLSFSQPVRAAQAMDAVGVSERSPVSTPIKNTNSMVIGNSPFGAHYATELPWNATILIRVAGLGRWQVRGARPVQSGAQTLQKTDGNVECEI